MIQHYNLLLSYTWEYDQEFAERVKKIFENRGLSIFIFTDDRIDSTQRLIESGQVTFDAYLDRSSDVDERYEPISKFLSETSTYLINPQELADEVIDKAYMHPLAEKAGIPLPKTIIIPPLDKHKEFYIAEDKLDELGKPFIVKPCFYTGGGEGVLKNATLLEEVLTSRNINPDDSYLIQQKIYPATLFEKRAWFRILWAFGDIYIAWWDDEKHTYFEVTDEEFIELKLDRFEKISRQLAKICKLDYFSTETTITQEDQIFVIDYVNDQCDMRLKSNHPDGVPETIIDSFIESLIKNILNL